MRIYWQAYTTKQRTDTFSKTCIKRISLIQRTIQKPMLVQKPYTERSTSFQLITIWFKEYPLKEGRIDTQKTMVSLILSAKSVLLTTFPSRHLEVLSFQIVWMTAKDNFHISLSQVDRFPRLKEVLDELGRT